MAIFSVTWQRQKNRLKITLANINEAPCFLPLICLQSQKMSELPASWRTMCCFIQGSDNTDLFSSSSSFFYNKHLWGVKQALRAWTTWILECTRICHVTYRWTKNRPSASGWSKRLLVSLSTCCWMTPLSALHDVKHFGNALFKLLLALEYFFDVQGPIS